MAEEKSLAKLAEAQNYEEFSARFAELVDHYVMENEEFYGLISDALRYKSLAKAMELNKCS